MKDTRVGLEAGIHEIRSYSGRPPKDHFREGGGSQES